MIQLGAEQLLSIVFADAAVTIPAAATVALPAGRNPSSEPGTIAKIPYASDGLLKEFRAELTGNAPR
ncbi:MAG: hypothetical protein ABR508_06990 [Candidatus Baltobacteraceae bacterium]